MTAEPVFVNNDIGVSNAAYAINSQHSTNRFDVASPSSSVGNGNNCWILHSPASVSNASPLLSASAVNMTMSEISTALKDKTQRDATTYHNNPSCLRHSPTFSESHGSFLSPPSNSRPLNINEDIDPNDDRYLTSICTAALSDISTDHLLDFVLRLTDTPPDRPHCHNNSHSLKDFNCNDLQCDVNCRRPRCTTEDTNQLHRPPASNLNNHGIAAGLVLDGMSSFAVHQNPNHLEDSLFSRSITTTSETPDVETSRSINLYINAPPKCTTFQSSSRAIDAGATCRSSLSLISNNGSLTTAASTPSGTPTWSQDLTPTPSVPVVTATNGSSQTLENSTSEKFLLLGNRLLCSPLSDNSDPTKGPIEDLLSDEDDQIDPISASHKKPVFTRKTFLGLVGPDVDFSPSIAVPSGEPTAIHGLLSNNRVADSIGIFQSSPQCKNSSTFSSTGLRHMNSGSITTFIQTAAGGSNREDDVYLRSSNGGTNQSNQFNLGYGDGTWNEETHLDQRRPGGSIAKGLTDFYSLAYASKRWQNLNVVLPLYVPHGVIAVIRSTGENTYVFPDQYPASQLLFSGAGKICDMWATYLRLRVAVIHKCPEFLVPRVAQVFNHVLANLPKFSEPIHLRCAGVVKHTIQLRSSGGLTYRYDTIGQISNSADQEKMRVLFEGLQKVMSEVNNYLAREVEGVFRTLRGNELTIDQDFRLPSTSSNGRCGLEFRFSPCKELKIAIREGTVCDCAGVDSVIAGGGASSMSAWAQQFIVENLIVGELRLERDKTSETQLDPFFLPRAEIKTRMISKDLDGNPARISFVDPSVYPDYYRPRVDYAIGSTPFHAAEQLVGATHQPLAKQLPNGLNSLHIAGGTLHIPGVSAFPPLYSNTALTVGSGSSSSVPVTPYAERNTLSGAALGRQPFGQTVSNYSSSPALSGPPDPSSWSAGFPGSTEHRQDPFSYSRQQQPLGWNVSPVASRAIDSNRETPVAGDTADALKGLAVLQKMLSNLNIGNQSSEVRTETNGLEQSPPDATSISPSSSGGQHQLGAVLGQAAAAAIALGRHHDTITKTPEAAALLSQLQSALQKIPSYFTAGTASALNQQRNVSTPEAGSSASPLFTSPKREDSIRQQQEEHHSHLPFPCINSTSATARQHLFEIESLEDIGGRTQTNSNDSEGTTPHIIDEHDLALLRGSKSVGATPLNYSSTTAAIGASPTTSTSFGHHIGSSITERDSTSPTPCTTVEARGRLESGGSSALSSAEDLIKGRS